MANAFSRLMDRVLPTDLSRELQESQRVLIDRSAELMTSEHTVTQLQESVKELSLYMEDLNWTRLDNWNAEDSGLSLKALQENADKLQALLAINPTVKKAMNARVGYIWGRGLTIKANQSLTDRVTKSARNQAILFSEHAYWGMESNLATAGNLWAQRVKSSNAIALIPLDHIGGWSVDEDDPSRVNYWLVQYEKSVMNFSTGVATTETVKYWVPAHDNENPTARRINDIPVDRTKEMVHLAANRQTGWILGVPDIMAVMFWTKAHKELFEAGTTFVKAQGKFAAKVVSKSETGGQNAAATLRDSPRQNDQTGEVYQYGGTAVATGGLDYQLMGKMSGGVDFSSFDPVGGLIAAGLGIPLDVLLSKSPSSESSLEQSTVNEMQMRQKLWSWFYVALFGGTTKASVVWPKIRTEPEYRRIQSIEISNQTNVLSREEMRRLTLEAYDMDGDESDLPGIEEQAQVAIAKQKGEDQADVTDDATVPDQGVDAGIGKLSTGADAKDARNNPLDGNVANQ